MNKKKIIVRILIVLWLCLIWGHSLQPSSISDRESGAILQFLIKTFPTIFNNESGMFIVRKTAHFLEFMVLGILLCSEFISHVHGALKRFLVPAMAGLFVAFIDETIQLFVAGRSGEVRDMWIDFSGVLLGTLITMAISNNRRSKRR
ncbi:MAG: VanZ family protein [Pseudobutyrivibrio sp.]|nr:VanZ family protein [Pseudobutyrivibrio sp.]